MGFELTPSPGGYAWWYLDALSDDGVHGITIIAFVGSVFSPYYAWARRRGEADPQNHCALNVAVYGPGKRWTLTERGASSVHRTADTLAIGRSTLAWSGSSLVVQIDEIAAPLPRRVRGTVRLHPAAIEHRTLALDVGNRHRWRPIAPCARAEVALETPAASWSGPAYLDTNTGDRSLETDFSHWQWSRAPIAGGTVVLFDVMCREREPLRLAMRYNSAGGVTDIAPPDIAPLPSTLWRIKRSVGADATSAPTVVDTLTDAPFYARSVVATRLLGTPATAMHESLSLDRFRRPWVQAMLPFRIPRGLLPVQPLRAS